jgi:hypothetical protein
MMNCHESSIDARTLRQVATFKDLDDLIRQSEFDTGLPGRDFVVSGPDLLRYHVRLESVGYEIRRSDVGGQPAVYTTRSDLGRHLLGHALVEGYLFTSEH